MKPSAPRHTCETARSGSEKSENTCAACKDELARSRIPTGYGDMFEQWQRQTVGIGRKS